MAQKRAAKKSTKKSTKKKPTKKPTRTETRRSGSRRTRAGNSATPSPSKGPKKTHAGATAPSKKTPKKTKKTPRKTPKEAPKNRAEPRRRAAKTRPRTSGKARSEELPSGEPGSDPAESDGSAEHTRVGGPRAAKAANDVEHARTLLVELTELVAKANDRKVAAILGEGRLEALLGAVLPQRRRPTHSVHQHLLVHKERSSLMASVRHAINSGFALRDAEDHFVAPTRVQWFYDGLTFVEGEAPFEGVMSLYRENEVRYGLQLTDADSKSLGPADTDFVSVDHARRSFRSGTGVAGDAIRDLLPLRELSGQDPTPFIETLVRQPWLLGAQHVSIERPGAADPNLPEVFAKRVADGQHDILVFLSPAAPSVGKNRKLLSSFEHAFRRAERLLAFVERQSDYLSRELGIKVRRPRCYLFVANMDRASRDIVRSEREAHSGGVRVLTYAELCELGERTFHFFQPRIGTRG